MARHKARQGELEFGESPRRGDGVYVRVAVERGMESLSAEDALTYFAEGAGWRIGERVEVPLGRKGVVGGIVVKVGGEELLEGMSPARVKPVSRRMSAGLSAELVELGAWIGQYYCCPLGMVYQSMLPAAVKHGTGARQVEIVLPGVHEAEKPLKKSATAALERLREVSPPLPMGVAELAARLGLKTATGVKGLIEAGVLKVEVREDVRARGEVGFGSDPTKRDGGAVTHTSEQAAAIEGIAATLGSFKVHLLQGVTGSGKTEVYLSVMERVLARGETAVVLVPEIALTPQTAGRFTRRFGDVAVMHSGLTASQRHRAWARAASGEARVVVGARSAVFAPLPRLGLIVVDEEHDGSYKQDQLPRYHARDVAVKRAQGLGIPVVLGSATPSLESYANAKAGRYVLHRMTTRPGESRLPGVKVVDLAQEGRLRAQIEGKDGRLRMLGPTLEGALERVLKEGGQAILLLNRRGFAHYLSCPSSACGTVIACDSCDARLVLHKGEDLPRGAVVRCHHCLAERIVPELCPTCGRKLNPFGGGTQRLEAEVVRSFASMGLASGETLLRLDADTMRRATDYFEALEKFGRGEARVIVGTQMVAKGLDFPGVRLVGVVDADTSLNIPDFRSEERTFQLVSQVAGRAGRGEKPGVVIVQTFSPGASAIVHAARHDYEGFAEEEMKARSVHGLPPTTRMARIVCRDEDSEKAWARAEALSAALQGMNAGGVSVSTPTACPVGRIAERTRIAVDVIARSAVELQGVLREARRQGLLKSDAATAVDVDPVALL